jgi:hypothetical protein
MSLLSLRGTLVAATSVVLLAGCGSNSARINHQVVSAGDPDYVWNQLAAARESSTVAENEPASLRKALPNYRYKLGDSGRIVSFADAVAVGTLNKVEKGNGVIWRDDKDFTVVSYDDPEADTRTAYVTLMVDRVLGAIDPGTESVTFRVVAPPQADPQRFIEGLAGLQRIAVVLDNDPDQTASTPWRPIMGDSLIGVINDDGSLTLPALGADGKTFEGSLDTRAALLDAAQAPNSTEQVAAP